MALMKLRSPISLKLVRLGYPRGSREFKNAYQKELRKRPYVKTKEKKDQKKYYLRKLAEDPSWNSNRIKTWRHKNPSSWKAIAKRSYANGAFKKYYEKNKEKIREKHKNHERAKRRKDPLFGIYESLRSKDADRVKDAIQRLNNIVDELD